LEMGKKLEKGDGDVPLSRRPKGLIRFLKRGRINRLNPGRHAETDRAGVGEKGEKGEKGKSDKRDFTSKRNEGKRKAKA